MNLHGCAPARLAVLPPGEVYSADNYVNGPEIESEKDAEVALIGGRPESSDNHGGMPSAWRLDVHAEGGWVQAKPFVFMSSDQFVSA